MKKFKLKNYNSYKNNYISNILDIWYQNNKIVAYIKSTQIYKTELIIGNNRIENYYCSCRSCDGGMHFCKHLVGLENYLRNNEIPELEYNSQKEDKVDLSLTVDEVLNKFKSKINDFLDLRIFDIKDSSLDSEVVSGEIYYIDLGNDYYMSEGNIVTSLEDGVITYINGKDDS